VVTYPGKKATRKGMALQAGSYDRAIPLRVAFGLVPGRLSVAPKLLGSELVALRS